MPRWFLSLQATFLCDGAWAGLFIVYSFLCFCICRFLFQQVRSPPSIFSATHCSTQSLPRPCPQPFQHLPTHSKSCKRKLTFVSPHLIRGLDHYIRRDNYFPIFCLWRGVSLTGIKCLQSTAFLVHFLYISDFVWQEGEGESMLKITSLRWGNEKDYWRWFNYNPSSCCCCCFNSISFSYTSYGSVSAGREKWPFNVLFFRK